MTRKKARTGECRTGPALYDRPLLSPIQAGGLAAVFKVLANDSRLRLLAADTDHRLDATKLLGILRLATPVLEATDLPVEVEYEDGRVSQFPVSDAEVTPSGVLFHLGTNHTHRELDQLAAEGERLPTPDLSVFG